MKQLTGIDASFLYMESPTSFGHVNSVVIYERPDDPDFDPYEAYRIGLEKRLHLLEPLRRKLVEVPFALDHPYWINDEDFDLNFHLRHIALPGPGTIEQLAEQTARIIARPCDRSRPLWEVYVIEGLESGDFAILTKVHHATVDGALGVEMLMMMLDADPAGDEIPEDTGAWRGESKPSDLEMLGRTAVSFMRKPGRAARAQLRAMQHMAEVSRNKGVSAYIGAVRDQLPASFGGRDHGDRDPGPAVSAPTTPWNKSITPHRRLALRSTPLDTVKALKSDLGVTLNDVVMAVVAGGLREYLVLHDALPERPLRAMVPVSLRTGTEADPWTNRVSSIFVDIPTHLDDPIERVHAVHESMNAAKEAFELVPAESLVQAAEFALPGVAIQASRAAGRLADRGAVPVNVVISNVPGPRIPLYMGGARMRHFYPVSTIAPGVGLNVTVQSYLDTLDFGLVADRQLVPDLDTMARLHVDEIDKLVAASGV